MAEIIPIAPAQEEARARIRVREYRPAYRTLCTPDSQQQAERLEMLRYKWGGYAGNPRRIIQWAGDILRPWFPWVGRGWNGVGPR